MPDFRRSSDRLRRRVATAIRPGGGDTTMRPFKIVGQLVMIEEKADGQAVAEPVVGQITLYADDFDRTREIVEQAWASMQNGGG